MLTIITSISTKNWFIFWLIIEINIIIFIPILKQNKIENCNRIITYFIIQSFASIIFFIGSIIIIFNFSIINSILINIALIIKLAIIPFHSWLILIRETLDYNSFILILTIQKIIPLLIINEIINRIVYYIRIISLIFRSFIIFNLKLFKKILIFSSISHLRWIIIIMYSSRNFWVSYIIIYFIIIFSITKILKKTNVFLILDLIKSKIRNNDKISLIIYLMSLGGIPPFIGFIIKFLAINIIIKYSIIRIIILIMSSLINIFIYIQIITPILIIFNKNNISLRILKSFKNLILNRMIIITLIIINLII